MEQPEPDLEDVLDATADIVIEDSLGAVTARTVATRVQISEQQLLRLIPTTTDLLVRMVDREYAAMFRIVLDNVDRDPMGGLLSRIYRYNLAAIYERPLARALYLSDPSGLGSIMRAGYGLDRMPHLQLRSNFVYHMQLVGMVRPDADPTMVAAAVSAMAAGMALTTPHDDLDDILDGVAMMLARSVDADVSDTTPGKAVFCEYASSLLATRTGGG